MTDWKWLGTVLVSALLAAGASMYALRTFLHANDVQALQGATLIFALVVLSFVVAHVRFKAWKRQYLLSEDSVNRP